MYYNKKTHECDIHTDKGIYRGGETVNIDIYCFSIVPPLLRPINPKNSYLTINVEIRKIDPYNEFSTFKINITNLKFKKGKAKTKYVLDQKLGSSGISIDLAQLEMRFYFNTPSDVSK